MNEYPQSEDFGTEKQQKQIKELITNNPEFDKLYQDYRKNYPTDKEQTDFHITWNIATDMDDAFNNTKQPIPYSLGLYKLINTIFN